MEGGLPLSEKVKAALDCIYGKGHSPEAFKQADSWLQDFQHSDQAWQVADALLDDPDSRMEACFFAAETLYAKIKYDFTELPPAQVEPLKVKLVTHLSQWGQRPNSIRAFLKKLCVAVAALSVQTNWQSALPELVSLLQSHNVPTSLVLELMEVLPEECHCERIVVDEDIRASFRAQLLNSMPHVLGYLSQMDTDGNDKMDLQKRVFDCMERWIHHFSEFPSASLVGNKVVDDAFRVSMHGWQVEVHLHESAVNLLVELLHIYSSNPENSALTSHLIPQVMQLATAYDEAVRADDNDAARGFCRIFTEMAVSYMSMLLDPLPMGQEQLAALVLKCAAHPDPMINSLTLDFWSYLTSCIDRLPKTEKDLKVAQYQPCLSQLILVCVQNMRWPDDLESLEEDQKQDVAEHRYKLGETLKEVCHCLGGVYCVQQVAGKLQEEMAPIMQDPAATQRCWRGVEACLWAIRSMASLVPEQESLVVPQVMHMILQLSPQPPQLRVTANHVIGKLARWVRSHQELLQSLYQYLLSGMSAPETASSAAISIRDILMACGHLLGEPALQLYEELLTAAHAGKVKFGDETLVLEGLSSVVSTLPYATAKELEKRMITPVAQHMLAMLQQAGTPGFAVDKAAQKQVGMQVGQDLDRLTVIIRYCEPRRRDGANRSEAEPSPSVEMMQLLWPVLQNVRQAFNKDEDVLEKLCRVFKHALRAGKEHFNPIVGELIDFFVASFRETHVSSFLYACSICVGEFGGRSDRAHEVALMKMLSDTSGQVVALLSPPNGLQDHPDVVEEYFYLVARFLSTCPQPLLQNHRQSGILVILDLGIAALDLQHLQAQKGVLHFLETLVKTGLDDRAGLRQPVTEVIREKGQALVHKIVYGLVGEMPSHLVDESGGSLAGLLWRLNNLCPDDLRQWVYLVLAQSISEQVAPNPDKSSFLSCMCSPAQDKDKFIFTVRRFGRRCRDNARRWRNKKAGS